MKYVAGLKQLDDAVTYAVIINCGTKWFTTLALASIRANAPYPTVIIDCESRDGSEQHFAALAKHYGWSFYWLSWPLREHWKALDHIFVEIPSLNVLLVDSDVELRSGTMIGEMEAGLQSDPSRYGGGLLHAARWMGQEDGLLKGVGYYSARMWIPLVLLRVSHVRAALRRGASFAPDRVIDDAHIRSRWSRFASARHRIKGLRAIRVTSRRRGGVTESAIPKAVYKEYDTGARLHEALAVQGLGFAELPTFYWQAVHHYHGMTRLTLAGWARRVAVVLGLVPRGTHSRQAEATAHAMARLRDHYGVDPDVLSRKSTARLEAVKIS